MDKSQRFRKFLHFFNAVISFTFFSIISIVGLFAIYIFLVEPAIYDMPINYTDVVFGFGILSIGLSAIVAARRKTQAADWLVLANIAAWFLLHGIVFDVSRGIEPNLRSAASSAFCLILLIGFIFMARRSHLKERISKRGLDIGP